MVFGLSSAAQAIALERATKDQKDEDSGAMMKLTLKASTLQTQVEGGDGDGHDSKMRRGYQSRGDGDKGGKETVGIATRALAEVWQSLVEVMQGEEEGAEGCETEGRRERGRKTAVPGQRETIRKRGAIVKAVKTEGSGTTDGARRCQQGEGNSCSRMRWQGVRGRGTEMKRGRGGKRKRQRKEGREMARGEVTADLDTTATGWAGRAGGEGERDGGKGNGEQGRQRDVREDGNKGKQIAEVEVTILIARGGGRRGMRASSRGDGARVRETWEWWRGCGNEARRGNRGEEVSRVTVQVEDEEAVARVEDGGRASETTASEKSGHSGQHEGDSDRLLGGWHKKWTGNGRMGGEVAKRAGQGGLHAARTK
ncbi:hypothetical protein EDB92DRAFT_1819458 [Lactarius akahatsu]|uniref:Uncharacterized protein n=1 Tax=Lactarius akahatsu TaxID=416441 RepID=A0AAD4L7P2_9AGAM|nr:hypothetical protein EDB92DRAFT_1819458 [Lactarius akahatsu]